MLRQGMQRLVSRGPALELCRRRRMCSVRQVAAQERVRVGVMHLGMMSYEEAWDMQCRLRYGPPAGALESAMQHVILTVQHPHVYTLGYGAVPSDVLFAPGSTEAPAPVVKAQRGGKVTYHGPGQLVVYPLLDLRSFRQDLHWYVRSIEEVLIRALNSFQICAQRATGLPGVWVGPRKIAQVGMMCSKWRTSHGFALNVAPDMGFFRHIVPCGIQDRDVTCMRDELGRAPSFDDVQAVVLREFEHVFNAHLIPAVAHASSAFVPATPS